MEPQNNLSLLTELLPQYRALNSIYSETVANAVLDFDNQCLITDFYKTFDDIPRFEQTVLNFILLTDTEKQRQIIGNFRSEIDRNIEMYAGHKDFFDNIDTLEVCRKRPDPIKLEREAQLHKTQEFGKKLTSVRNNLESESWKNNTIAVEKLTREEQRIEASYKENQKKLNSLFERERKDDEKTSRYTVNVFRQIHELSNSFLHIIESYFPVKEENVTGIQEPITTEPAPIAEETPPTESSVIEPDMIFRARMYERFLLLEQRLIKDNYLDENLHWVSTHENGKPDIKSLIVFLAGLQINNYFLPNRDPKIKQYFETRYHIRIGQNFEKKRREPLTGDYKVIFHDYPF